MPPTTRRTPRGDDIPPHAVPLVGSTRSAALSDDDRDSDDPPAGDPDDDDSDLGHETFQDAAEELDQRSALRIWEHAYSQIRAFDGSDRWYLDVWIGKFEAAAEILRGRVKKSIIDIELLSAVRSRLEGEAAEVVIDVSTWKEMRSRLRQQYRPDLAKRLLESQVHSPDFWRGRTIEQIRASGRVYYSVIKSDGLAVGVIDAARRRLPLQFRYKLSPDMSFRRAMNVIATLITAAKGWNESPGWLTATSDRQMGSAVLATGDDSVLPAKATSPSSVSASPERRAQGRLTGNQRRRRQNDSLQRENEKLRSEIEQLRSFGRGQ